MSGVYAVAPGAPFLDAFAKGLLTRFEGEPEALARTTVYLPTRRLARLLGPRLSDLRGGPVLAPRALGLADIGAGRRIVDPTRRLLSLTALVRAFAKARPDLARAGAAAALARSLGALIDEAEIAGVSLDRLDDAAGGEHAAHWTELLAFLDIARHFWPQALREADACDPEQARRAGVMAQIAAWEAAPPSAPVIIAGDSGRDALTRALIVALAGQENGVVVLPALDPALEDPGWAALPSAPEHPQAGLAATLAALGLRRKAVARWGEQSPHLPRARLLAQAMRPAPVTDGWARDAAIIRADAGPGTQTLALIAAPSPRMEALAIACAMRETLTDPDKTVALVTPDRVLGRRVAAALTRWGVTVDDSGGRPLNLTPPGVFLRLCAEVATTPPDAFDPAALLSLVKHPLASMGRPRGAHARLAREFEIRALRGMRADPGLMGVRKALADGEPELLSWVDDLIKALAPLTSLRAAPFAEFIAAHRAVAEAIAAPGPEAKPQLWAESAGEAAQAYLEDLIREAGALGAIEAAEYPALFDGLSSGRSVRAPFGLHPRAFIWGLVEARGLSADRMILGGLEEGVWPETPDPDPWLSRPMRRRIGLPSPEEAIGRAAQDFAEALCAPEVILTIAAKREGAQTVPSRWLIRLQSLLGGLAPDALTAMRERGAVHLARAASLDRAAAPAKPAPRPEPKPPVAARPTEFWVTDVETLIRDPYAFYARRVLRLRPLDEVDQEPDARDRGEALHDLVERFLIATPDWPDAATARARYDAALMAALTPYAEWPAHAMLWRARAEAMRAWFLTEEAARRETGAPRANESRGSTPFQVPGSAREFTLRAKADRIDLISGEGWAIYDYKTGAPPSQKQITEGYAQQLPLEGAIALAGGFEGLAAMPVARLAHIHLKGGREGGETREIKEAAALSGQALERLSQLAAAYEADDKPYLSRLRPEKMGFAGDYDHLARVAEWSVAEEDE